MKKYPEIKLVPDQMREELDFLGHIYCPAKEVFSDGIKKFVESKKEEKGINIKAVVPMGACGKDEYFNINRIKDINKLPSILTGAGFTEYFEEEFKKRFVDTGNFDDLDYTKDLNSTYEDLNLKDPKGAYNIYSAFPYIFLVDKRKFKDKPIPLKWEELLDEKYKNSIAVGHTEEDINEIVLLYIYKNFGKSGIEALARNINMPMGNVEMAKVAGGNQNNEIAIYIMPYFFAKATPKKEYLEIIWPEEGGFLCPLYVMVKKQRKSYLNELVNYLYSADLGQALANKYFPHVNKNANNLIPNDGKLQWLGWDYIHEKNIITRVREIEEIFYEEWKKGGTQNEKN
jgi:ABC-type Fe3+ transport system substrate-binding protein